MRKLVFLALLYPGCAIAALPKLLPVPSQLVGQRGTFVVSNLTAIGVSARDTGAAVAGAYLSQLLRSSNHLHLKLGHAQRAIRFVRKRGFGPEAYAVEARPTAVTI